MVEERDIVTRLRYEARDFFGDSANEFGEHELLWLNEDGRWIAADFIEAQQAEILRLRTEALAAKQACTKFTERVADLKQWLADDAPYCATDQKHLDANTPERAYWHYGYLTALCDALAALSAFTPAPPPDENVRKLVIAAEAARYILANNALEGDATASALVEQINAALSPFQDTTKSEAGS